MQLCLLCCELKFVLSLLKMFHVLQSFAEGGLVNIGGLAVAVLLQLISSKPHPLLLYHPTLSQWSKLRAFITFNMYNIVLVQLMKFSEPAAYSISCLRGFQY